MKGKRMIYGNWKTNKRSQSFIPTERSTLNYCHLRSRKKNVDFIIGVSGESMEPTFHDGDLVYVQKCQIVQTGEIGIFILNGECLIKEAGENELISHNRKYAPIPGNDNIICIGKVLGKVTLSDKS